MNRITSGVLLTSVAIIGLTMSAQADPKATWRAAISQTPLPGKGCYAAHYPRLAWKQVKCVAAPNVPLIPASGAHGPNVGNGNDYQAVVSPADNSTALISTGTGSFPTVEGLKKEKDGGTPNSYSLQLNSNYMSGSPSCAGAAIPSQCQSWEQFAYVSTAPYNGVFMEYWLINYNNPCPSGWQGQGTGASKDCFTNSPVTTVPLQVITDLEYLTLTGSAVADGLDTVELTTQTGAYGVTNDDDLVYLADYWQGIEFNVLGNDSGSEADFNSGTAITVNIDVTDGTTNAPGCIANGGTSGETNNLTLGNDCTTEGGSSPSVSFTESN